MKKSILTLLLLITATSGFAASLNSAHPNEVMQIIQTYHPLVYLSMFFGLGLLLAFTPCVLPMVPILSGIITGQNKPTAKSGLKLSLGYVAGMAVTYAIAGMLAASFGSTIQTLMQKPVIIVLFSGLFVVLALWLFGLFELRMPAFLTTQSSKLSSRQSGVVSAALMGSLSTLVVSPCVTAPLVGILTYVGQSGHIIQGGLILFVLALGMGVPLVLFGAGYSRFLPKTGAWMITIKNVFGLMMLALAVWLLGRVIPVFWMSWIWAAFIMTCAITLHVWQHTANGVFKKMVLGLSAMLYMSAGAIAYQAMDVRQTQHSAPEDAFIRVQTLDQVKGQLAQAKRFGKPVFIEFFASWCSDCKAMDQKVFNQPKIQHAMQGAINMRVDISDTSPRVSEIRQAFGIYGIPTMIFYNKKGQKLDKLTAVGQISKSEMFQLLTKYKS